MEKSPTNHKLSVLAVSTERTDFVDINFDISGK